MNVLVDTSVWSLAFRKKTLTSTEKTQVDELKELIHELRAEIVGPIRQELLSGIEDEKKYTLLREKLTAFDDVTISRKDYETAAEIYNRCRRKGIQGSHTDFLICAVSINHEISIYTTDKDFQLYKSVVPITLYKPRLEESPE